MIENQYYAIESSKVERVIRCAALISLPQAAPHICGAMDLQGQLIPIFSLRKQLNLPQRELALSDQFIICWLAGQQVGLWVDETKEMIDYTAKDILAPVKGAGANNLSCQLIKDRGKNIIVYDWEEICQLKEWQSS